MKEPKNKNESEQEMSAAEEDAAKAAEAEAERKAADAKGQHKMAMPAGPLTDAQRKALDDFVADFNRAPPPMPEKGNAYISSVNDRWSGNRYAVGDGIHMVGKWSFEFHDGRFLSAREK